MNRREFLRGASAAAAVAAIPLPVLAETMPAIPALFQAGDTFYNGVIIREVFDLNASARMALRTWASRRELMETFPWGIPTEAASR